MIPEQSYLGWKVAMTVLQLTAVGTTAFRLYYRHKTQRLWWDDYTAIVPLVAEFIYIPISYLVNTVPGSDKKKKVILYYFWVCAFMTILWWSRLSLGFSIARIFPPALKPRKYAFMIIFGIFLTWIALLTAEVSLCATNTSWHDTPTELLDCRDNYPIGIALATTDVFFNILLITFPIYRLWHIKLPQDQRRMVLAVFSASLITLLSAIVFTTISYSTLFNSSDGGAIVNRMMGSIEVCSHFHLV
ncbi:hypothetical protein K443DRAFT_111770 [Laccaria amethystina LaAM-08-1]|uniref:Rhodopsin domain-containing protein n=1 Tax=Laccaria amethystina LaAM-08-1 TaxID=1095629 RepID=A0A0C9XBK5_9AGAR|nr:hypothetical protein K443DRAFT_111770 [Laccaria amethystina LaAM-08-1]